MSIQRQLSGAIAASSMLAAACAAGPTANDIRVRDRECEVVVSQQLHSVIDVWETRFGVIVWCRSVGATGSQPNSVQQDGEITVTVSPANGSRESSQASLQRTEELLRPTLEGIVKREGWEARYPKRILQAMP